MSDLQIDVVDMLERLGIDGRPASGGSECNFSCPFHVDERPSAYMNMNTTAWFCWSCKGRGKNAVSFVKEVMQIPYAQAKGFLRQAYGVNFHEPEGGSMDAELEALFAPREESEQLRRPSTEWLKTFHEDGLPGRQYARSRGLKDETIDYWSLGYDWMSNRMTIPIHDINGNLIGFKGRAIDDSKTKYLVLGDKEDRTRYGFDIYEASNVVFGLDKNQDEYAVLVEGELNAIALHQIGITYPIALGMSYLTDTHLSLIVRNCKEVTIFFDPDQGGEDGLPIAIKKLEPHVVTRVVKGHDADPAKMVKDRRINEIYDLVDRAEPTLSISS